jgi:hypothetical protein
MIAVSELKDWAATLSALDRHGEHFVAVDDGGLTLVEIQNNEQTGAYLEVGGEPSDEEGEQR